MPFRFQRLEIPDVVLVEGDALEDDRGVFMETYKRSAFASNGILDTFVQANYSHSGRGVLRGLHYQMHPKAQAKLVMALGGEVFDVAVDLRRGSPTYGRWTSVVLSSTNRRMLYVPVGFAHGFCTLSAEAHVYYLASEEYASEYDRGIVWNDPQIGVRWPVQEPRLSLRDARHPALREADNNFVYEAILR